MSWPDTINGLFEIVGSFFVWANVVKLHRDKQFSGVYWPTTAFYGLWGLWNILYYPVLGQWLSAVGGVALAAGNITWVVYALRLRK